MIMKQLVGLAALFITVLGRGLLQEPNECSVFARAENGALELKASSQTVHWGYVYDGLEAALVVNSGDEITVEMATHHAGDDYEKMVMGDPGMEDIYAWDEDGLNIPTRGANGAADGVHVLTGPIYVCGAEPGDVLQVDILDLTPRLNPQGQAFGSNAAAWWGYHQRTGFFDGDQSREVITIYEVMIDEDGRATYAVPDYQFTWKTDTYLGPNTSCILPSGEIPRTLPGKEYEWSNEGYGYGGGPEEGIQCTNDQQTWGGIYYTGLITEHPTGTEDYSIRGKFKVPVNMHIGNMGLAPAWPVPVNSIPPLVTGGNIDNKRIGIGATMYYPVQVEGALLSMGDAHAAQGDSELDGTAIEMSVNGRFKVTLHKKDSLPTFVQDLDFPLLENDDEFVVHGFTYKDYLNELEDPQSTIFGVSNIDRAMNVAVNNTKSFVMKTYNLTEDQAITAITTGVDFGISQVVDGNWGVHAIISKEMFEV
eukprot:TRINITY_DN163_c0_g1_i2.p1 TRINITY_DN163_c0_g1~~TRINITY_DN163_c0_g1_i2.p1  ORF type:complete len:479 (+),score=89.45 TRINITY_DN163_c0_g1_i2:146-1582(+)